MSAFHPHRASLIKRCSAAAAAFVATLAIAGPVTTAGAATASDADPGGQPAKVAVGPTLVGTVFNGSTTIVTTTG